YERPVWRGYRALVRVPGRTAAPPCRGRVGERCRDGLAEHRRGDPGRGTERTAVLPVAVAPGATAHAESRGLAALPRCTDLAGGCNRLPPTGEGRLHAVHAPEDRRHRPLCRRARCPA